MRLAPRKGASGMQGPGHATGVRSGVPTSAGEFSGRARTGRSSTSPVLELVVTELSSLHGRWSAKLHTVDLIPVFRHMARYSVGVKLSLLT